MTSTLVRPLVAAVLGGLLALVDSAAGQSMKMYFVGEGKARRANLDGTVVEVLIDQLGSPEGVAVDGMHGKVYWTDFFTIGRMDLDGQNPEVFPTTVIGSKGIAVDAAGGRIYWAEPLPPRIRSAKLDGTDVKDVVTTGAVAPHAIRLDVAGQKIYWTNKNPGSVQRANFDGTSVETIGSGTDVVGLALDLIAGRIYWSSGDRIRRAESSGGPAIDVVVLPGIEINAVAVDTANGRLYWSRRTPDKIQSSTLSGGDIQDVIPTGVVNTRAIDLDVPVCPIASANGYGAGWPGTIGVPPISLSAPPKVGTTVTLAIDNSRATATNGLLVIGAQAASLLTALGGTLLVVPSFSTPIAIPPNGLSAPVAIPADGTLCGASVFLQSLMADPGASHGVAFTPGLRVDLGI